LVEGLDKRSRGIGGVSGFLVGITIHVKIHSEEKGTLKSRNTSTPFRGLGKTARWTALTETFEFKGKTPHESIDGEGKVHLLSKQ